MDKEDKDLILKILKVNIEDLNNNKFDTIYDTFYQIDESDDNKRDYYVTPLLTTTLLKTGIDSLRYMNKIPAYYLTETKITNFIIPKNIKEIGYCAFYFCKNLNNIELPNGLGIIGEKAFSGCNNLKKIRIPKSVNYVGKGAFAFTGINQVIYDGTLNDFRSIDIRENNAELFFEPTVVTFSNGKKMVGKRTGWFEV